MLDSYQQIDPMLDAPPDGVDWPFPADPVPSSREDSACEAQAAPRRILIVEDSRPLRELYRVILEMSGYMVTLAEDGAAGLVAALRERPDFLLVDISMPVKDGVTMLEELRLAERRQHLRPAPAVLLSAAPSFPAVDIDALSVAAMLDKAHLPPRKIVSVITSHLPDA